MNYKRPAWLFFVLRRLFDDTPSLYRYTAIPRYPHQSMVFVLSLFRRYRIPNFFPIAFYCVLFLPILLYFPLQNLLSRTIFTKILAYIKKSCTFARILCAR